MHFKIALSGWMGKEFYRQEELRGFSGHCLLDIKIIHIVKHFKEMLARPGPGLHSAYGCQMLEQEEVMSNL